MNMNVLIQDDLGMSTYAMVKSFVIQEPLILFTFTDGEERDVEGTVLECWLEDVCAGS